MSAKTLAIISVLSMILTGAEADDGSSTSSISADCMEFVKLNETFYVNISISPLTTLGAQSVTSLSIPPYCR